MHLSSVAVVGEKLVAGGAKGAEEDPSEIKRQAEEELKAEKEQTARMEAQERKARIERFEKKLEERKSLEEGYDVASEAFSEKTKQVQEALSKLSKRSSQLDDLIEISQINNSNLKRKISQLDLQRKNLELYWKVADDVEVGKNLDQLYLRYKQSLELTKKAYENSVIELQTIQDLVKAEITAQKK